MSCHHHTVMNIMVLLSESTTLYRQWYVRAMLMKLDKRYWAEAAFKNRLPHSTV